MSIELASRRGPIGKGWHAVALREAGEDLLGSARVGRGKADARAGRVQWLDVAEGVARGDVLDADGELYQARLELPAFRDGDRQAFLQVARARPELPARMAGGNYPHEVEAELARSEMSLLPRSGAELTHDCSCLDWPGPCRHVAALLYVLVEAVDERPVLLLTLRGLTLEDLVAPVAPVASRGPTGTAGGTGVPGEQRHSDGAEPSGGTEHSGGAGASAGTGADGATGPAGEPGCSGEDAPGGTHGAAEAAPQPPFDPARTDPSRLAEMLGEEVAAMIHSFYTSADPTPPQPLE